MTESNEPLLILKILSGPHLGAEVRLVPGEITLGSADDCDIVLNDQSVAAHHARVSMTDDGPKLTPLDGEVLIDGEPIDGEVDLPPLVTVSLGTTSLAVGPADEPWPKTVMPIGPYSSGRTSDAVAADTEVDNRALAEEGHGGVGARSLAASFLLAKGGRGYLRWICAAVLVVLVILVPLLLLRSKGPAQPQMVFEGHGRAKPSSPGLAQGEGTVKDLVARVAPDQQLTITTNGDGEAVVSGYVESMGQLRSLHEGLAQIGRPVEMAVWAMAPIVSAAQGALQAEGQDIEVTAAGDGALRVEGLVSNRESFAARLASLRADMPGIRKIDDRTVSPDEILGVLKSVLRKEGIADSVHLTVDRTTITVAGQLTPEQDSGWKKAREEFVGHYGDAFTFDVQIDLVEPDAPAAAQLDIRGISLVGDGYLVTADGSSYKVGHILRDGSKLLEINESAIILKKDGRRRPYYYRGDVKWIVEKISGG